MGGCRPIRPRARRDVSPICSWLYLRSSWLYLRLALFAVGAIGGWPYLQLAQQPQPGPVQLPQQLQPPGGVLSMTTSHRVVVAAHNVRPWLAAREPPCEGSSVRQFVQCLAGDGQLRFELGDAGLLTFAGRAERAFDG